MSTQINTKQEIKSLLWHTSMTAAVIAAVAVIAAILFGTKTTALSIAAGWLISLVSFSVLVLTISTAFVGKKSHKAFAAPLGILKLAVVGVLIWWLTSKSIVDPLALLGGFSTVVIALIVQGMRLKAKVNR